MADLSPELRSLARNVIQRLDRAEMIAPAGTYEHGQIMGAALRAEWPKIKAILMIMSDAYQQYGADERPLLQMGEDLRPTELKTKRE